LKEDLEWKLTYVGSAKGPEYDQVLDDIFVGPVNVGVNKFLFQTEPPDPTKIPSDDLLGVTVILLECSYIGQEFVRVGFYVNNEYEDPELQQSPPATPDYSKIARNILVAKPRVTRFQIDWDPVETEPIEPTNALQTIAEI